MVLFDAWPMLMWLLVLTSCIMSRADDLQYCRSRLVCACTWLTKLYTMGMVMQTERIASSEKLTAE